jgi:hypothetical protein
VQEKYNIAGNCTPGYDPDEAAQALLLQLANEETVGTAAAAGVLGLGLQLSDGASS